MAAKKLSSAFPALVMIVRHGEKPGAPDRDDDTPSPDLSIRGSARAAALPTLFTPDPTGAGPPGPQLGCQLGAGKSAKFSGAYRTPKATLAPGPRFPTPKRLKASKPSKASSRPVETLTPTAHALGLKIRAKHPDDDYAAVASDILKKHGGEVVLVCWHHGRIPGLALALGVPQQQVTRALGGASKWPGTVFDWVWSIDWKSGSANLTVANQQLLYGDSGPAKAPAKK